MAISVHRLFTPALLAASACTAFAQSPAPSPALAPQGERITDAAIHADQQTYQEQQGRIRALNDSGRHPLGGYAISKAQCWLDVSFHEYTRNDRSAFPQEALAQSYYITEQLAGRPVPGQPDPVAQTPRVNGAELLRPDLWEAAARLKQHAGFRCVAQRVACAEVELVHAGNEFNQQQWRHAKPYIQIAEDLLAEGARAAEACVPPPAPVAAAPVTPPAPPAAVQRRATVLFEFDKRDMAHARAYTVAQLDALLGEVGKTLRVTAVSLSGHADVSNGTGDAAYNDKLSRDRVEAVKAYLVQRGVPAAAIRTAHEADRQPVVACERPKFRSEAERQECLLPNRRVEVLLEGTALR